MTRKFFTALASASALCLAASAAHAGVTFVGYQSEVGANETLVTGFEGGPSLSLVTFLEPGYSIAGDAVLFTGKSKTSAAPAIAPNTWDPTQYLSVQKGQSATLDTPLLSSISFYIGSLDSWNIFSFKLADGSTQVVTGKTLSVLPGMSDNGSQTAFTTNGRLTFSFDSAIDSVMFSSNGNSLEISDIGAVPFPTVAFVPEPTAWALMIMGFGGMGTLLRRRNAALAPA